MNTTINKILYNIADIKISECQFLHPFYKDIYVSFKQTGIEEHITKHLSKVDFDVEVSIDDIVRLYEFIIRKQEQRMLQTQIKHMNLRMYEKVFKEEALSVHERPLIVNVNDVPQGLFPFVEMSYLLPEFVEDVDYCNIDSGRWIYTIGKHKQTDLIFASHDNRFYDQSDYICLFLR